MYQSHCVFVVVGSQGSACSACSALGARHQNGAYGAASGEYRLVARSQVPPATGPTSAPHELHAPHAPPNAPQSAERRARRSTVQPRPRRPGGGSTVSRTPIKPAATIAAIASLHPTPPCSASSASSARTASTASSETCTYKNTHMHASRSVCYTALWPRSRAARGYGSMVHDGRNSYNGID